MDLQISKFCRVAIYSALLVSLLALIRSSSVLAQTPTDTPEPFSAIQTVTPAADGSVIHTVQAGESLNLIATAYGITVGEIKLLNNLTSDMLSVGQKLIIPTGDVPTTTPSPLPTGLARGAKIKYKVLLGDTLETIAIQFNSRVQTDSAGNPTAGVKDVYTFDVTAVDTLDYSRWISAAHQDQVHHQACCSAVPIDKGMDCR